MNLSVERLGQGERIAAGSALGLFACMFLSWFNFSYVDFNAWEALNFISPILAIAIVATLSVAFAQVKDTDLGDINGGLVIFVLGCLASLLILYRLIDPISAPGIDGGSTNGSVEAGAFLGFIAALGIAAGGYLATDGKAVDRLKAMVPSGGGSAGNVPTSSPPPPPVAPPTRPAPPSGPENPPAPVVTPVPPVAVPDTAEVEAEPATEVTLPASVAGPAEEVPQSLYCEGCGSPMRPQDRFCRKCGREQS